MNCEEFQSRIGAACDGELDDASRLQLEAHLSACCECREVAEGLDRVDAMLRRSSRIPRRRAEDLAGQVTFDLSNGTAQRTIRATKLWWRLAAAVAAGFLMACLVFQPWQGRTGPGMPVPPQASDAGATPGGAAEDVAPAVARVVATTGPIDVRLPDQPDWVTVTDLSPFTCPSDTCVKTPRGSLCELATSSGSVVRMRDETEVKVHAADELQLSGGHLWIQVPDTVRLLVTASDADATSTGENLFRAEAVGPAVMMQCVNPDPLTVTSCSGSIDVGNATERKSLAAGGTVQLVNGTFVPLEDGEAPLLAEAWMHPLLTRKGLHDPELEARVDALLARIGKMKMALLYEQQIRGLGEYAALPLLKFIETTAAGADAERRAAAARILADIAPVWLVPDLIELLPDSDPRVGFAADRALVRLTGRDSGRSADEWAADENVGAAAYEEWGRWWEESGFRYTPAREDGAGEREDLYLKARD